LLVGVALKHSCKSRNSIHIDVVVVQGHDFLLAVDILKNWLEQYLRDLGRPSRELQSVTD
jgi:hypothetical protein